MAEKKEGFFKRLFRFGKKKREDEVVEDTSASDVEEQKLEADRVAAEQAEIERQAKEEQVRQQAEAEARENERLKAEAEAQEKARVAAEEAARKKQEEEASEQARLEEERARVEAEKQARLEAEEKEAARKAEQAEKERLEAERDAAAKAEAQAWEEARRLAEEAKKAAGEERKKLAAEQAEAERLAQESAEAERKAAEQAAEQERLAREQAEAERIQAEQASKAAAEKAAEEETARQQAEAERAQAEEEAVALKAKEEADRLAQELAAQEQAEKEEQARLEEERLAAETTNAETVEPKPTQPVSDEPAEAPVKKSWFSRLKDGLSRSSNQISESITSVFTKRKLDEDTLQELEDILIQADLGVETAMNITDALASQRMGKDVTDEEVRSFMAEEVEKVLEPVAAELELDLDHRPHVILVVGVNGSGKTTTIGKLSQKLHDGGFSTLLVAGDTFRAAAIEQLKIWGDRTQSPVVSRPLGSDAAGLAFDAFEQAKSEGRDVMMMDTAGRLQNKKELMDELEKIIRVLKKQDPNAPHTVLLTLDATTGQNALNQVEIFKDVAGVNGLVMTKLDGTARGGIMVAIAAKHKLPVYFVGVGEQVDDLEPFEARDFARSIAGLED